MASTAVGLKWFYYHTMYILLMEKGIIPNLEIWFEKGMDIQNSQLISQTGNNLWKY